MDWLLTVPLLLIEIVFCMKISAAEMSELAWKLGFAAAAMIILGYPGELIMEGSLSSRWMYWAFAMIPFCYIVYTLLIGLSGAIGKEDDPSVKVLLSYACWATVVSWCTYPVVYIFPMFGLSGADAVIGIQLGYCVSDIISKCGVGFLIYNITITKSALKGMSGSVPLMGGR
jgi:bacteriorhodopsin